jgi:aspartate aminotransferase-like enzyme
MPPRLWIPGPTHVRPEILAELARPQIGHRGAEMSALIERLDPGLRLAFGIEERSASKVAVHTTSATGIMEAALRGAGPRVLCVVQGAFGARWREIALALGKEVLSLEVAPGEGVEAEAIAAALRARGPFDAVTVISNETATGVRLHLDEIGAALAGFPDTLLLVDLVSWLAGCEVRFDEWRLDCAFAGVQKALALPPGISVLAVSERFLASAAERPSGSFYLDPTRIVAGHLERKTPATPSTPHYWALARQLEDVTAGRTLPAARRPEPGRAAWRARFAEHEAMRARTAEWCRAHGLGLLPAERFASATVSCVRAGALDVAGFVAALKERGHAIGKGYGPLAKSTFRIGHMGDHLLEDLEELLAAADAVLAR